MHRALLGIALATAMMATAADAAPRHKHRQVYASATAVPRSAPAPAANRPVWASPYECFTDEGYGRFWPCGAGRSN